MTYIILPYAFTMICYRVKGQQSYNIHVNTCSILFPKDETA